MSGSKYHNIDGFGSGRYAGYAHGAWSISKVGASWVAFHQRASFRSLSGSTLGSISRQLDNIATLPAPKLAMPATTGE